MGNNSTSFYFYLCPEKKTITGERNDAESFGDRADRNKLRRGPYQVRL